MKNPKLGTRVTVNGVETFISELHADIKRGVYKVRTSNPCYEFCKQEDASFVAYRYRRDGGDIELQEAPKYGNYQVGDRIQLTLDTWIAKKGYKGTVTAIEPERLVVTYDNSYLSKEGFNLDGSYSFAGKTSKPILKKLRVKLGETR